MRDSIVARNYAETLFALATKHDAVEAYGEAIEHVARLLDEDGPFALFLETPRIDDEEKKKVVRKVFGDVLPRNVVNFLLVTIDKRRQRILRTISTEYHRLLDAHMGREHVQVTVARPVDDAGREAIAERLSAALGKTAIPHIRVDPAVLGGVVVRTGDTIYDGSLRRRLDGMRRQLLEAELPDPVGGTAQG